MEEDLKEEELEDPSDGQVGQTYKAKTEGGNAMAKMLRQLCQLSKAKKMPLLCTLESMVRTGSPSSNRHT